MDHVNALQWRYATKKFNADKLLPEEKVQQLKQSFNLTATSFGLQPLKLLVIQDKALQRELQAASYQQQQIGTASHVLVLTIEQEVGKEFIENYFKYVHQIRETPEEIVGRFRKSLIADFESKTTEEIHAWATNQAYLALGTLLTVCALEGIDSCPMEGFEADRYTTILGLDRLNLHPVLVLPVGYRDPEDFFSRLKKVRRPLEETVIDL